MKTCPENCDASCYRCLRSFKNKFEHRLLDRHVAAELLEYLLTGTLPEFDAERLKNSTDLLYRDLLRQDDGSIDFKAKVRVSIAGAKDTEIPILAVAKSGKRFAISPIRPADRRSSRRGIHQRTAREGHRPAVHCGQRASRSWQSSRRDA